MLALECVVEAEVELVAVDAGGEAYGYAAFFAVEEELLAVEVVGFELGVDGFAEDFGYGVGDFAFGGLDGLDGFEG